jgi:multidrug efflux pump
MSLSGGFIDRPIGTTLITLGVALAGALAYLKLPVAPLPQVEFPTISVQASLPGASPETMASTVATPLERALGAIAGVNEMTSNSSLGNTRVTLQFDLDRDINGAARDVQAALNAARALLPTGMPFNPTYRKVNPADSPILILSLTSGSMSRGELYDVASTVLTQRLSQVDGVGQVSIGGGALPAVRIELDPHRLSSVGLSTEQVRQAVVAFNANRPKGILENSEHAWQIEANDQAKKAEDYAELILSSKNAQVLRLKDVAQVRDSVQDLRNYGSEDGKPAILVILNKQPSANVIETVKRVRALFPVLKASMPAEVVMTVVSDRTPTLNASLFEIQKALAFSIALVVLVVGLFLKRLRAALIPSVAVPVSLAGAFALMYLLDYSLNNLSLMALTIASGFVVDDAIVVLENVIRHMERGDTALEAARKGTREIGFTVLSMSLSLIAVFIPILLMGGILGRLFQEFAVVLSGAILISMLVSLSTTPMMCAALLRASDHVKNPKNKGLLLLNEKLQKVRDQPVFNSFDQNLQSLKSLVFRARISLIRAWKPMRWYRSSLAWCLRHSLVMFMVLVATIALNVSLYKAIPKGFFPQQDTGRIFGNIRADQSSSFQSMQERLDHFMAVVKSEPSVDNVTGFTGGGQRNAAQMFITLKPRADRDLTADQLVAKLRMKLGKEAGARLFLIPSQDIRIGARISSSQYEFTMKADELQELKEWEPKIRRAFSRLSELEDINTDYEDRGLQTSIVMDREALSRLGVTVRDVDNALSNAFSQRQVGVIYNPLNQYRVVLEWAPEYLQSASSLKDIQLLNTQGQWVPLSSVARVELTNTALSVSHEGGVPSDTFSFNLAPGVSLSQATEAVTATLADLKMPVTVRGSFSGTANAFQKSLETQPWLILAALMTLYLVLGVLYESLLHPLTILSTLPSAGVGALIALMLTGTEFSVIALIGVILLIGIVKKNAILMIDFAIQYRRKGMSASQSIYKACQLRVRPILMTTLAAMLGALPLAFGQGDGSELRHPLGVSVLGGLVLSQLLTLYTTPVVYVLLEQLKDKLLGANFWRQGARLVPDEHKPNLGIKS